MSLTRIEWEALWSVAKRLETIGQTLQRNHHTPLKRSQLAGYGTKMLADVGDLKDKIQQVIGQME